MRRLLVACALLAACRGAPVVVGPYPSASVVLVSIDTLRADRLPLYGYKTGSTPALDALGRQGIVFEDVYSHCPLTLPAHSSLLTGLLPPHHGVRDNIGFTLAEASRTLATRFKAAGWRTGAAVSAYVLRRQTGIAHGFDFYEDALTIEGGEESLGTLQRDGAVAVDALARWVEAEGGERCFAFLHLYEPHSPYTPPARHAHFSQPYDGEVAYADELVGRFLDRLRARGFLERAIVAVTADHGEGLDDHGESEHGIFLYREALRVPLILRLPDGARAGSRVKGTVAQVDIAPTLLELAGLGAPGMDGQSLRASLASDRTPVRPVYSETLYPRYHFGWSDLYSATEGRYRYIRAPQPELYDVDRDPGEKSNLVATNGSTASAMSGWLARTMGPMAQPDEVPQEVRERLAALGYVGTGPSRTLDGELPDPKQKIGAYDSFRAALLLRSAGRDAEAVARFRQLVAENPRMLEAWESLGLTLIRLRQEPEAIAALGKVLELDPLRADTHLALAKLYALDHKMDPAVKHAEIASGKEPGKGFEVLAQIMLDEGRPDSAAAFARKSLAADPQRVMSEFVLGVVAQRAGRYSDALEAFLKAEAAQARERHSVVRNLHFNIGDCLARLGRDAEAEREFRAELVVIPSSREARVGLAMLYRSQGRDAEAREALTALVTADPQADAEAYWTVVHTFSVLGDTAAAREWASRARGRFPADKRFR